MACGQPCYPPGTENDCVGEAGGSVAGRERQEQHPPLLNQQADTDELGEPVPREYDCLSCAACCQNIRRPPYEPGEIDDLPTEIIQALAATRTAKKHKPCPWLGDDNRCRHYKDRPKACKDFEIGGKQCKFIRVVLKIDEEE